METSLFLAQLLGLSFMVLALALLARHRELLKSFMPVVKNTMFMFYSGILSLIIGLAIVLNHNVWLGSTFEVMITMLGWWAIVKGLLLMFVSPKCFVKLLKKVDFHSLIVVESVLAFILGYFLAGSGFGWF